MANANSYQKNSDYEQTMTNNVICAIAPLMQSVQYKMERITTKEEQLEFGDIKCFQPGRTDPLFIDFKFEKTTSYNMFFETVSNYNIERRRDGWGNTVKADFIWYMFEDLSTFASIRLAKMRTWLNGPSKLGHTTRIEDFKQKSQKRYSQLNETVGRLIPFKEIPSDVYSRCLIVDGNASRFELRSHFDNRLVPRRHDADRH
jgi:hypothetical protein